MFARMTADGKLEHFAAFTFRLVARLLQFASGPIPVVLQEGHGCAIEQALITGTGGDRCCAWGCFGGRYVYYCADRRAPRRPTRPLSGATISSTLYWRAATATRRATPMARSSRTRRCRADGCSRRPLLLSPHRISRPIRKPGSGAGAMLKSNAR